MKSTWVRFLVLAIIGFGLGAGFAVYQKSQQNKASEASPATTSVEPAIPEILQRLPDSENVSSPEMMAGVAVGGPFSLTDQKGNAVTEKSWPGKYKLIFFGFSHCGDVCPAALQKFTAIMEKLDPNGEKLAPMMISVDPERDTPEKLAAFIAPFNKNISALTGTRAQIDEVINEYKVFAAKVPDNHEYEAEAEAAKIQHHHETDYMVDHSAYTYLMSPDDKLLETFASDTTAEDMLAKIKAHVEGGAVPAAPAAAAPEGGEKGSETAPNAP